jgi:hypothetical protein
MKNITFKPWRTWASGCFILLASAATGFADLLQPYANTPDAIPSQSYSITVNGKPIFVEKFKDISYARFAFSGTAKITITAIEPIKSSQISPLSYGISGTAGGRQLTFSISQPRKLIAFVNQLEKLFIFADPPETQPPQLGDANVVNVMKYVHDNTGATLQTAEIQQAIDAAAAINGGSGGVLYFPDGKYLTGSFYPAGNVTIYLASGALIQGSADPKDYVPRDGAKGPTALIHFKNVHNARIMGRGTIAVSGTALRAITDQHIRICNLIGCQDCGIYDVVLRDSAGFNIHIFKSAAITMKDYKIVNDLKLSNQDGTDPDSSTNVTVDGVFMYTSDDAIAVKADAALCENILIRDCVFWTVKSALKVGSDPQHGARNITFENNDVVHADRALALYVGSQTFIDGVNYLRDKSEDVGGDAKRQLIIFDVSDKKGSGRGTIKKVNVVDYTAYKFSPNKSTIKGLDASHQVSDVTFKNLLIDGHIRTNAADARIDIQNASNIVFEAKE